MMLKKPNDVIERVRKMYPEATPLDAEIIAKEYSDYMRSGFDMNRIVRFLFQTFIVTIPALTLESIFSSMLFKPGSIGDSVLRYFVIFLFLFFPCSFVNKRVLKDQDSILADLIHQYRSKKESESVSSDC